MCGRFASTSSAEDLVAFFEVDEVVEPLPEPSYNIAPTMPIAAVLTSHTDPHRRQLAAPRWGLVPSWATDADHGARLINARVETVASKPSFRAALARRRCLIPADGYYEWRRSQTVAGKIAKQPYYLAPGGSELLAMAGLYEYWRGPTGEWLVTATIITTTATDQVGMIHDRMPMVVPRSNWAAWLDHDTDAMVTELLAAPSLPVVHPVSTAVNWAGNNGPQLVAPIEPSE
jgi:putative SOS response-associated peptidase YedK